MNKIIRWAGIWKAGALLGLALALQGCVSTGQEKAAPEGDEGRFNYMGLQDDELPLLRDVTLTEEPGHVAALTIRLEPPKQLSTQPWAYKMLWPTPHMLYVDAQGRARMNMRSDEPAPQARYLTLSLWPIRLISWLDMDHYDDYVSDGTWDVSDAGLPITQYEVATWRYPGAQVALEMRDVDWAQTMVADGPWAYTVRFFPTSEPSACLQGDCLSLRFMRLNVGKLMQALNEFQDEYVIHVDDKVRGMDMGIFVQDMPWDQALSLIVTSLDLEVRREGTDIYVTAR